MDIARAIREFLEHIEIEKNRSKNTLDNYGFYLERFLKWADPKGITKVEQVSLDVIRAYRLWLNHLHQEKPLKISTQNYHLIALRSFLKYLAKRDIKTLAAEKIELAKMPARDVSFLDGEDLERFLALPSTQPLSGIIRRRDRAILELFFSTGLRVSELASLRRENVNLAKDEFTVLGKADKYRIVFLSPRAREHLKHYLDARKDMFDSLFIRHDRASSTSQRTAKNITANNTAFCLTPRSIQRLVQKYAKMAGITKHITPHGLRHSFATDLLVNGADIRSVQTLLGHASITTTQIYTHVTNQQLHDVHKAFHGRRRKK